MEKIGLITCYIENYGACLQAFAMQKTLSGFGYDSDIIRYDYKVVLNDKKYGILKIGNAFFQRARKRLDKVSFRKRLALIHRHNKFVAFRKNHLKFSKKINSWKELPYLDNVFCFYVCGSDQIWNPTLFETRDLRFDTLGFTSKKKIAYAPSIGVNSIEQQYLGVMRKNISTFSFVSCRESFGTELIKHQLGIKNCETVLDPTFTKFVANAVNYFKKLYDDIDVVIIPFSEEEYCCKYKKINAPKVFDFINLIKNAELVLTDSFHGTAFSINMNSNFYVFSRFSENDPASMNSRIHSILHIFSLENRLITSDSELENISKKELISFDEVNAVLKKERSRCLKLFEEAVENAK